MTSPRSDMFRPWMDEALKLADFAAASGEVPVGAVVVRGDEIVGRGSNAPIGRADPTAHAEIRALRMAAAAAGNYRLPGTILVCTVEPCLMCLGAALHARVETVVFGASDPKVGACARFRAWLDEGANVNHRFDIVGGVLEAACAERLTRFFRERREE